MTTRLLPCWTNERLTEVFRKQAADVDDADFLASHTPMRNLTGDGLFPKDIDEDSVLSEVARVDSEHTLVVVRGGPGGGKSHLIRWLSLRLAPRQRDENMEVIFVEREASTLRGVIQQIASHIKDDTEVVARLQEGVGRLNEEGLIGRIRDEWAREVDRDQIRLENLQPDEQRVLFNEEGVSWGELFRSEIAHDLLSEKGGFFHRIARQIGLERATDSHDAMVDPGLAASDLRRLLDVPTKKYRDRSSSRAAEARDYLEAVFAGDGSITSVELTRVLNAVMSSVIRATLKISRSELEEIFRKIRAKLYQGHPDRRLVLLIEDLFPFKHLDESLMNALIDERRAGEEIARMTAVVGMTTGYWDEHIVSGRAHIAQRVTHHVIVPVGHAVSLDTFDGPTRFVSRYLNIVRQNRAELAKWAVDPASEPPSACKACPHGPQVRTQCFSAFGAVGEGDERVGLFPFTTTAASNFASALRENGVPAASPRLLVIHALQPLLAQALQRDARGQPLPDPALFQLRTLDFPEVANASTLEWLSTAYSDPDQRSAAEGLVRAWGQPSSFIDADNVGGVHRDIYARFGLDIAPNLLPSTTGLPEARKESDEHHPKAGADSDRGGPAKGEAQPPSPATTKRRSDRGASTPAFDARGWLKGTVVPDAQARKLAARALVEALEHSADHFVSELREVRLRDTIIHLERQQVSAAKGAFQLKASDVVADGLAAAQAAASGSAPTASTLRHARAFRRATATELSETLKNRETGEAPPDSCAVAVGWLLLLDGVLRGRVPLEAPLSHWFFWSLAGLDGDDGTETTLTGFEKIARKLGSRTDVQRRERLRDFWRRLVGIRRGDKERAPTLYASRVLVDVLKLFRDGQLPAEIPAATPAEANEFYDMRDALGTVRTEFATATAALSARAAATHSRIAGGPAGDCSSWATSALELCDAAKGDSDSDILQRDAQALELRLRQWSVPTPAELGRWLASLKALESSRPTEDYWRASLIFSNPPFLELESIVQQCDGLAARVENRVQALATHAPTVSAFQRVRDGAKQVRDLLKTENRW